MFYNLPQKILNPLFHLMGAGMVKPNPALKKGTWFFVLKFSCIKTKIKQKQKLKEKNEDSCWLSTLIHNSVFIVPHFLP